MPDEPQHQLERELATFEKKLYQFLSEHEGKFALVKGDAVLGAFDTFEKAYEVGLAAFGTDPFLVKEIGPGAQYTLSR